MSWMTVFLIAAFGGGIGGFLGMMGYAMFNNSGTISQCEEAYQDGYREAQERFREQLEKIGALSEPSPLGECVEECPLVAPAPAGDDARQEAAS